ncbi:MAG: Histidinol dehydrogenase [uncultured Solirubrobacteraceae bacterium]|uniref:Histidinol dehydrogenase n=1 Tax=uncultured Solirubrobacteraceae bacterium TaxID=1162706 RepID=A0A6J4RBR0_9ACTN|nr:MAG: Histidinol dehydrogenase [uncultured Solirubrobacteraceae bacterium]
MPAERLTCDAATAAQTVAHVRALVPEPASVADAVREIIAGVRAGGDAAVLDYERRFGGSGQPLRVDDAELAAARETLSPAVRAGLEVAIDNVGAVARAGLDPEREVTLEQGQRVRLREVPVRRAAVYAPGGKNPYPSSVVMGVVTARAAGVDEVVVAAPPHPLILAAASLCGADEVYRMGGAQAIAALAHGTETVRPVDVIVGPGNLYVQEAKVQVSGRVGIDGFAGPSDLCVALSGDVEIEPLALDLLAQAEHGDDSPVVAISDDAGVLDALAARLDADGGTGIRVLVHAADSEGILAFLEGFAAEHLQLAGSVAEALAPRIRTAGLLLVGQHSGTAFSDYVAGSNHTLPTDGRGRFASGLSARDFRRRMAEVTIDAAAADALARAGVPIAESEGFRAHAASMAARIRQNPPR